MSDIKEKRVHHGRNIKRFREMLRLTQDGLAMELGEDWTQRRVSLLEGKEEIEQELLEQVANALKIPSDAIKNFDEEAALNFIGNTYNNHDNSATVNGYVVHYSPSFNPFDKVVQLYEEKIALYERMLKEKSEMMEKLEKLISKSE